MENKGSQILVTIFAFAVVAAGIYYFLISTSEREAKNGDTDYSTVYAVFCSSPATTLEECDIKDTAIAVNFKVDTENQRVFRWYEAPFDKNHVLLDNCVVVDKNNWNCDSSPGNQHGVRNGYTNGAYFESSGPTISQSNGYLLSVTKGEWEEVRGRLYPKN